VSVATYSPFIKAVCDHDSLPRIVTAIEVLDGVRYYHTVDMSGRFEMLPVASVTVDWRYNPTTELWDDPNAPERGPAYEDGY
jgi:hypothetical protein